MITLKDNGLVPLSSPLLGTKYAERQWNEYPTAGFSFAR
jgi:hypothetical protein